MNNKLYAIAAFAALPCLVQTAVAKVDPEVVSGKLSPLFVACHDYERAVLGLEKRTLSTKDAINRLYSIYEKANTFWHELQRLEQQQPGVMKDVLSRRNNKELAKDAILNAKKMLQSMNYLNSAELKKVAESLDKLLGGFVRNF